MPIPTYKFGQMPATIEDRMKEVKLFKLSRDEAIACGWNIYLGKPCPTIASHVVRYVKSGICVACRTAYNIGRPKPPMTEERREKNRINRKNYYEKNKERCRNIQREYAAKHHDRLRDYKKEYYQRKLRKIKGGENEG